MLDVDTKTFRYHKAEITYIMGDENDNDSYLYRIEKLNDIDIDIDNNADNDNDNGGENWRQKPRAHKVWESRCQHQNP